MAPHIILEHKFSSVYAYHYAENERYDDSEHLYAKVYIQNISKIKIYFIKT